MSYKAVILIAGPQKGTRFRPLSLDVPKPLFPVAGLPMIQHHIEAVARLEANVKEILILGGYSKEEMHSFIMEVNKLYDVPIRYLQEYTSMGTAGGIYHFRDRIMSGNPDAFFVFNGDVCADFPLKDMLKFHSERSNQTLVTAMSTEATRQQSLNFGCLVINQSTKTMIHFVEKPTTYVSSTINCGVYIFSKDIFPLMQSAYLEKQDKIINSANPDPEPDESLWIEREILPQLSNTEKCRIFHTSNWWSQIKTAGSAIFANRHYLSLYRKLSPKRLACADGPTIIGNVFIDPSAKVDVTSVIGPNVSIGPNVTIGSGTRVKESIILANSKVGEHSLVMYTVIGMNSSVGSWTRIEGTPNDPNPNRPFAQMDNLSLFNVEGKLNPSITILGCKVDVPSEIVVLNAIVLPHKQISHSFKNEIVL